MHAISCETRFVRTGMLTFNDVHSIYATIPKWQKAEYLILISLAVSLLFLTYCNPPTTAAQLLV